MTSCTRRSSVLADVGRTVLAGAAGGVRMNAVQKLVEMPTYESEDGPGSPGAEAPAGQARQ